MIEFGHLTHVGLRRELNEDTYYGDGELGLWLVADGMGGHEYGEVASALAREGESHESLRAAAEASAHVGYESASQFSREYRRLFGAPPLREFMLDSDMRFYRKGDVIFEKNDPGSSLFAIAEGSVLVEIDKDDPARVVPIGQGSIFGEVGLISGRRRGASSGGRVQPVDHVGL